MITEDEKYYDAYLDMFLTEGWKNFVEEMRDAARHLDSISGLKSEGDLRYAQGQLRSLENIIGFEDGVRRLMDEQDDSV